MEANKEFLRLKRTNCATYLNSSVFYIDRGVLFENEVLCRGSDEKGNNNYIVPLIINDI
jgi:hypothetical protein